jgi:hypothetical protein
LSIKSKAFAAVKRKLNDLGQLQSFYALRKQIMDEGEPDAEAAGRAALMNFPEALACLPAGDLALVKVPDEPEPVKPLEKMVDKNGRQQPITDFRPKPKPEVAEKIVKAKEASVNAWLRLIKQIDPDKSCGAVQSVQWIYDNAGTSPDEIDPDKVPSRGALTHLKHVQSGGYADFIAMCWNKTIPNKNQLDYESRFNDDGRKQFGLLDAFMKSLAEGGDDNPNP